ncbi:hypothetical protein ACFQL1_00965 [Halomicroarcula sp. GCM10025709]|nr:hypothetical protein [Halomicroarcula sp. YJ-61-S]
MADPGAVRLLMIAIVLVVMLVSILGSILLLKFLMSYTFES